MKKFERPRGKHKYQFFRLIYTKGKTAVLQLIKKEWPTLKERVAHQKVVDFSRKYDSYSIDDYARDNGFSEVVNAR